MNSAQNTRLKEITSHLRNRISASGIKAKVHMSSGDSFPSIRVAVPKFESRFTTLEIHTICTIAVINRLTGVRGQAIDPKHESLLTEKMEWDFYL